MTISASHKQPNRLSAAVIVPFAFFLVLALFFIFSKSIYLERDLVLLAEGELLTEEHMIPIGDTGLPSGMRVGVGLVYLTIKHILDTIAVFIVDNPTKAALYPGLGWGFDDTFRPAYIQTTLVPLLSSVIWKLIALSALYVVAIRFYIGFIPRMVYLAIVMAAISGWPDIILNVFFSSMRRLADWPISYYLFTMETLPHDIAGIFFLNFLVIYLCRVSKVTVWHLVAITFSGQLIFEYLGFVTGVSVFLWSLWNEDGPANARWRVAIKRLVLAGIISVIVAAGLVFTIYVENDLVFSQYVAGVLTQSDKAGASVGEDMWNFVDPKFTASVFFNVFALPIIFGVLFGSAISIFRNSLGQAARARGFRAATVVVIPFVLALIIGLPVSGYLSDLGRQAVGGVTVVFAMVSFGTELFFRRILHR